MLGFYVSYILRSTKVTLFFSQRIGIERSEATSSRIQVMRSCVLIGKGGFHLTGERSSSMADPHNECVWRHRTTPTAILDQQRDEKRTRQQIDWRSKRKLYQIEERRAREWEKKDYNRANKQHHLVSLQGHLFAAGWNNLN